MNKTDLVERICTDAHLNKTQSKKAIESIVRSVSAALKRGDDVTVSGFGTFSVYERKARNGRNPQTGSVIKIKSRPKEFFYENGTSPKGDRQDL